MNNYPKELGMTTKSQLLEAARKWLDGGMSHVDIQSILSCLEQEGTYTIDLGDFEPTTERYADELPDNDVRFGTSPDF